MNMHKHRAEALRRLQANEYEITDDGGVLIQKMGLNFSGVFQTQVNDGPWSMDPNIVVNQGIMYLLTTGLAQGAAGAAFYVAPFSGAITPAATLTGATFTATATEYTAYAETARVLWAKDAAASNAIGNLTTAALFTINGAGGTIRGAGLLSTAAKNDVTGNLIAAARFSVDKIMAAAEELRIKYSLTGTST